MLTSNKLFITLFLLLSLSACSKPVPKDLNQAASVVRYMMSAKYLSKSAFSVLFEQPKASDFVKYIFSEMGTPEWPGNSMLDDPEQMRAIGEPVMPQGIAYVPLQPDSAKGKQIVVNYDDAENVIIVQAYLDPNEQAVLEHRWSLPTSINPAPGVREMTQSGIQMGISYQAF